MQPPTTGTGTGRQSLGLLVNGMPAYLQTDCQFARGSLLDCSIDGQRSHRENRRNRRKWVTR